MKKLLPWIIIPTAIAIILVIETRPLPLSPLVLPTAVELTNGPQFVLDDLTKWKQLSASISRTTGQPDPATNPPEGFTIVTDHKGKFAPRYDKTRVTLGASESLADAIDHAWALKLYMAKEAAERQAEEANRPEKWDKVDLTKPTPAIHHDTPPEGYKIVWDGVSRYALAYKFSGIVLTSSIANSRQEVIDGAWHMKEFWEDMRKPNTNRPAEFLWQDVEEK